MPGGMIDDVDIETGMMHVYVEGHKRLDLWPWIAFVYPQEVPPPPPTMHLSFTPAQPGWVRMHLKDETGQSVLPPEMIKVDTERDGTSLQTRFDEARAFWGHWYYIQRFPNGFREYRVTKDGKVWPIAEPSIERMGMDLFRTDSRTYRRKIKKQILDIPNFTSNPAALMSADLWAEAFVDCLETKNGPLPWKPDLDMMREAKRNDEHEAVVGAYTVLLNVCWGGGKSKDLERAQEMRKFWSWLRSARIFEFTPATYGILYGLADRYVTEKVAGLVYAEPDDDSPATQVRVQEETDTFRLRLNEAMNLVNFPEKLPFGVCYFAWGRGVTLPSHHHGLYKTDSIKSLRLMATVVVATGHVFEVLIQGLDEGAVEPGTVIIQYVCQDGEWDRRYTNHPWLVHGILAGVNEHHTVMEKKLPTQADRRTLAWGARSGGFKPLPPPFYRVEMKAEYLKRETKKTLRRLLPPDWSHRWDVRGHEVLRLLRGKLPMDPELIVNLTKRGYTMFNYGPLPPEVVEALRLRHIPLRASDEWLAVHVTWREDYVKGPADKPYVPSVHVPTVGVLSQR